MKKALFLALIAINSAFAISDGEIQANNRCVNGSAKDCEILGELYAYKNDYARAVPYFQRSCELNKANGCYNLAILYLNGHGVAQSPAATRHYANKACELGHQSGCEIYNKLKKFNNLW